MKGYVQVYTGNGKGKTTAALGLTLRAAGAGLKVYIGQFLKTGTYSEIKALERFRDLVVVEQFGGSGFITGKPTERDIQRAQKGLKRVLEVVEGGGFNLVILEEINVALKLNLISLDMVVELLDKRPGNVELVLTGRDAHAAIIERADLVTEMKAIKHYYTKGVRARTGIEK
ncbi:MAG: cob(I)yrinic acid a,c-diamide adenosyltransferase [Spirochaetota bacterium]